MERRTPTVLDLPIGFGARSAARTTDGRGHRFRDQGSITGTPTPPVTLGILGSPAWLWQFTQEGSNANGIVDLTAAVKVGSGGSSNFGIGESTGPLTGTAARPPS